MRNSIVLQISCFLQSVNAKLVKWRIVRPTVIVPVDGGICSQMVAYLRGQYYAEKGINAQYDLCWFRGMAKDTNGLFDRPFELQMLFPDLTIHQPSRLAAWWYRHFMKPLVPYDMLPDRETIHRSVYLNAYLEFRDNRWFADAFKHYFPIEKAITSSALVLPTENMHRCAVHIRRGDMSYVKFEGYENSLDYFVKAMRYVQTKYKKVRFFLFSDEPDWVLKKLCPLIPGFDVQMISGNMGHVDLLLAAQCETIIASQGTMGRMAGLLNREAELIIPPTGDWGSFHIEKYRPVERF